MAYDAQAARAARREKAGQPFTFLWEGREFSLPSPREWPAATVDELADGKVGKGFLALLPSEDRDAFLAGKPTIGDLEGIMDACSKFYGLGSLGE